MPGWLPPASNEVTTCCSVPKPRNGRGSFERHSSDYRFNRARGGDLWDYHGCYTSIGIGRGFATFNKCSRRRSLISIGFGVEECARFSPTCIVREEMQGVMAFSAADIRAAFLASSPLGVVLSTSVDGGCFNPTGLAFWVGAACISSSV